MEYIGNCPKCKHHTIVSTVKEIHAKGDRNPQREEKCVNCGNLARITIIGEVSRVPDYSISAMPEHSTHNELIIHFWD